MAVPLLEVRGLRTLFSGERGEVRAVDGVDLWLERGRTLGIVGESGCGKSVTALSIMGLVPQPPGRIAAGEVLFEGEDLLKLPAQRLRDLRGDKISMIFQEPMTSLNPAFTVGEQITEAILRHRDAVAPQSAHLGLLELEEVGPFEQDLAGGDAAGRLRHEAHDRQRGDALAAARLADDAKRAPRLEREAHSIDGRKLPAFQGETRLQTFYLEQRAHLGRAA